MTDTSTSTPAPETPQPTRGQKFTRWFVAIALLISGIGGIAKGLGPYFVLPSCDSTTAADTLRSIFKGKDVELTKISDSTTLTSTSSEMTGSEVRIPFATPYRSMAYGHIFFPE